MSDFETNVQRVISMIKACGINNEYEMHCLLDEVKYRMIKEYEQYKN